MLGASRSPLGEPRPSYRSWAHPSLLDQVCLSLLWFAFYAQWLTVVPILVPDQVATILGADASQKEGLSGSVVAAGAAVALVIAPVAGALSDRARSPLGRRRPFLIIGIAGTCLALLAMVPFGPGSSLLLYTAAFLNLQFWWNWAAGPYAGLIPDVVPAAGRATASAWMNVMSVFGSISGNLLVALFYAPGRPAVVVAMLVAVNLVCLALTLRFVHEPPATAVATPFALGAFLRSFYVDPHAHGNFYWVLITRLAGNMGVWSIFTFLLFYLRDVIGVAKAETVLPVLLGAGAVVAVPASIVGARLADRYGLVRVVSATSWIMAAAATGYVLVAFAPNLILVAPIVVIFAASYGAYQAVDWALALAVLPSGESAGKDMGIWHIALVLPQIIGPALTGWIISGAKHAVSDVFAYTVAFGIAALWFLLSAALVVRVRLVRSG